MKELLVRIPDENSQLATQLLEKLGAEIEEKKKIVRKTKVGNKTALKKKKKPKISHTYLFGKWKNLDIDPKKLREEAWDRGHLEEKITPFSIFKKWKNIDLDPETFRKKLWDRSHKL